MNPVLKRTITALSVAAVVALAIIHSPKEAVFTALGILGVMAGVEYVTLLKRKFLSAPKTSLALLPSGLAVIALGMLSLAAVLDAWGNIMLLYTVAIVKISDMGGFAFGLSSQRLMKGGNHKMCPTISPNKSWEGLFGSVFGSCLVSCSLMSVTEFGWTKSLALGVAAALVGTAGDLVESKFKRWAGVKDSSTMRITNGMGGFLDMTDSLLFAPAAIYFLIRTI